MDDAKDDTGFDPDWMPVGRVDPSPSGDAGADGDGPGGRLSRRAVALLAVGALVAGGLGVGGLVVSSRASERHGALVTECERSVASMGAARSRLKERVSRARGSLDRGALSSARWRALSAIPSQPSVSCDAGLRSGRLEDEGAKARNARDGYHAQSRKVDAFQRRMKSKAERKAGVSATDRLRSDLEKARIVLSESDAARMSVPYLRSRLETAIADAEGLIASPSPSTADLESTDATLTDLTGQVSDSMR